MKKTISLAFVILAFLFLGASIAYRFFIFPAQIKHECFFAKEESERAWTVSDLRAAGMLKVCPTPLVSLPPERNIPNSRSFDSLTIPFQTVQSTQIPGTLSAEIKKNNQLRSTCENENNKIIDEYVRSNRMINKVWYIPATQEEYFLCLRAHAI